MNQINSSVVLLKHENDTLWNFIEKVMPFLEYDRAYGKHILNSSFDNALHRQIKDVLRQKQQEKQMEDIVQSSKQLKPRG